MRRTYTSRNAEACVECTACVAQCRFGALTIARPEQVVRLDASRCTACGRCVDACGYKALGLAARALEGTGTDR